VLLVSLDTVSATHLRALGGRAPLPSLERLYAVGHGFSNATTPWPETGPAHWSAMTGTWPELHGQVWIAKDSASTDPTLAEQASAAGWSTGAFIGGFTLTREESGLDRGFSTWDQGALMDPAHTRSSDPQTSAKGLLVRRRADEVVSSTLGWTAAQTGPWFAFVHLFNAHFPYAPDDPDRIGPVNGVLPVDPLEREARLRGARDGALSLSPEELQAAALLYEAGIAELDAALEALVAGVGCAAGAEGCDVIIVVMADHGESFAPEYPFNHRGALTPEALRVPLVFMGPGVEPGQDDRPASMMDIAPTLRGLMDLPQGAGPAGLDLLRGAVPADRALIARTNPFDAAQAFGAHRGPSIAVLAAGKHTVLWADGSRVDHGAPLSDAELGAALREYRGQINEAGGAGGPMPMPFGAAPTHRWTPEGMRPVGGGPGPRRPPHPDPRAHRPAPVR
jgi:arylsulfatase A-like enzyme